MMNSGTNKIFVECGSYHMIEYTKQWTENIVVLSCYIRRVSSHETAEVYTILAVE